MKILEEFQKKMESNAESHKIRQSNISHHIFMAKIMITPGFILMLAAFGTEPSLGITTANVVMLIGATICIAGSSMLILTPAKRWPWSESVNYIGE